MNVLATIRRIIWGIILGICITVAALYFAFSNTFLTGNGLHQVISKAQVSQTIRDDFLLPKVLEGIHASQYSQFLDDAAVTKAFNEALPSETLDTKLTPAIDSLQAWLNSKEPAVNFTIDTSDISANFISKLSQTASTKYASLPRCTFANTLIDAERGLCQSPLVSKEDLAAAITRTVERDPALNTATFTQETITLSPSVKQAGHSLPDYLNIAYGLSIIAAGVAVLVTLWLLFKHKLAGIVTIGLAGLLAGLLLFIAATAIPLTVPNFGGDPLPSNLLLGAARLLADTIKQYSLIIAAIGFLLGVIALITMVIMSRRTPTYTVRLHENDKKSL